MDLPISSVHDSTQVSNWSMRMDAENQLLLHRYKRRR